MNILSLPSLCMHTYASLLKVHHTTYIVLQLLFTWFAFMPVRMILLINQKPYRIPLLSTYHCLSDIILVFPDILLLLIMLQWTSIWVCILQSLCKYFQSITKVKGVLQKCYFTWHIDLISHQQFVKASPFHTLTNTKYHQIIDLLLLLFANLLGKRKKSVTLFKFALSDS